MKRACSTSTQGAHPAKGGRRGRWEELHWKLSKKRNRFTKFTGGQAGEWDEKDSKCMCGREGS